MAVKSNDVVSKDTANKKMVNVEAAKVTPAPVSNTQNAANSDVKKLAPTIKVDRSSDKQDTTPETVNRAELVREELVKKHLERLGVKQETVKTDKQEVAKSEEEVEDGKSATEVQDSSIDSQTNVEKDGEANAERGASDEEVKTSEVAETENVESDKIVEAAKKEEIDPELAKDFAVKKLLKRIDALTSKSKQLETKIEREVGQSAVKGDDLAKWTPDYAETMKKQYQQAIDAASDLLFDEIKRDDDGNEIPLDINGQKITRKELRHSLRTMQEEAGKIDGYVKQRAEIEGEREQWTAKAVKTIDWFGDDNNQVFVEAKDKWDEINRKGPKNVPYAEYVFARGWDAIVKEFSASNKKVEVKKSEPKPTTPKAAAVKPMLNQQKRDELDVLKETAEKTGKYEDKLAYRTALHLKRLNGSR